MADPSSVAAMEEMVPQHQLLRVSKPEEFVEAIRGSRIDARLLARAPGFSQLERIPLTRTCFDTVSISSTLLVSGDLAADCFTMVFVRECPREGHLFTHSQRHGADYLGFFPPGGVLDALIPAGYSNATLTIPENVFLHEISCRFPEVPREWLRRGAALRLPESAARKLSGLVAARREMDDAKPGWLADQRARLHFENDLLEAFLDALRAACDGGQPTSLARGLRRYSAMRRIREHITARAGVPLRIQDLTEISGMSRRGLEYVFNDLFGVGANAFIRSHRLHGARRALLAARPSPGIIKETALQWGFWHLGRFSAEYRAHFGELPTSTISRAPRRS